MAKQKSKRCALRVLLGAFAVAVIGAVLVTQPMFWQAKTNAVNLDQYAEDFDDYIDRAGRVKYLSDEDVNPYNAAVGYGQFRKDEIDANGTKITLRHEGQTVTFDRGLWAHATSRLYYDLTEIDPSRQYTHFIAYEGLNTTSRGGDGVTFNIYGSNTRDRDWVLLDSQKKMPAEAATFVKVAVQDYRYLLLEAHQNAANGNDHSVWADAKLATADYTQYIIPDIEKYDNDIRNYGEANLEDDAAYELTVLRRDFVSKVGQYSLSTFVEASAENRRALEWIYNDLQHMRWFVLGGTPRGSYLNALNILSQIYTKHSADMSDGRQTGYAGLTYGDVYSKLMISTALTHSAAFGAWYDSREISDPMRRYEIYKSMYERDLLEKRVFTQLEVEEMRFVTLAVIGDDEIEWLNNLARERKTGNSEYNLNPYSYIRYTFGYNYGLPQYYTEENRETWDNKYHLSQYGVPYGETGKAKLWMVFEQGSVCGGLSKTGSNLWNVFGLPATVIGQPGHAAYLGMSMDEVGDGYWGLGNDVFGWTKSQKGERFILGWGSPLMHTAYNVTYFGLGQDAINDMDNYTLAEETLMLKGLYNDESQLRKLYRRAIDHQAINLDAWYGLIQLYLNNPDTTEETYVGLAKEIAATFRNYPLPMVDLMNLIKGKLTSAAGIAEYDNAQKVALQQAKVATKEDTKQFGSTRTMANYLLGANDYEMASFSFDGENAGKIVLGSQYDGVLSMQYEYSLDGGNGWNIKTVDENTVDRNVALTQVQLAQITEDNDIKVRIVGANDLIYTIDITRGAAPANLYANDQENRIMGVDLTMEWCEVTEDDSCEGDSNRWVAYRDSSPQRLGEVAIRVRRGATGTSLTSEPTVEYRFTTDAEPDRQYTYIPVSHLSLARVSSEALGAGKDGNASYALDGNFYTRWHSNWNGADSERYIVVEFDNKVNLSRLEYIAGAGGNGHIKQADIYVSTSEELNRDNFVLAGKLTDNCEGVAAGVTCRDPWPGRSNERLDNARIDSFDFDESIADVKYVAIKTNLTSDGARFVAARMFNFYEDRRDVPDAPTASLVYSATSYTKDDVLVRLVNPSTELFDIRLEDAEGNEISIGTETDTIQRIDETTVNFKENGEYKFTFTDSEGTPGKVLIKVNWIDRESPVGYIEYDRGINNPTNKSVTARLMIQGNEPVTVTNNIQNPSQNRDTASGDNVDAGGDEFDPEQSDGLVWDPFTYTFEDNGEFTFEFEDAAGNKGTATARVDWIDKAAPKAMVTYDVTEETEGEVVARLEKVSYVDELLMRAAEQKHYDADGYEYDEDFIVKPSEGVIINEDQTAEYHFNRNGEFNFEYCDVAGNCATTLAKVDWIREKPDDNRPVEPGGDEEPGNSEKPGDDDKPNGGDGVNNDQSSGEQQPGQSSNDGGISGSVVADNGGNSGNGSGNGAIGGTGNAGFEAEGLPEGVKAESKKLVLTSALRAKFGANSELYEMSFVDENGEKVDNKAEKIVVTVSSGKKLEAIYIVKDDGTTEKVEFERVDDTHVEIKNPVAGKYLFDYAEPTDVPVTEPGQGESEEIPLKRWYEGPLPWIAGGVVAVLAVGGVMYSARRKK